MGGKMPATDAPFLGVEVIGTRAYVLCQTEALALVAKLHYATRSIGWKSDGFAL